MVTAALRLVFAQESADEILSRWDDLAASLADRFPKVAELMQKAREELLAFRPSPGPLAQDLEHQPAGARQRRTQRCA